MKQSHEGGYSRATAALTDFAKRYNMTLDKLLEMNIPRGGQKPTGEAIEVAWLMPQYPGGVQALMAFLRNNVKYPAICEEHNITGRSIVKFIVEKDGSISNVDIDKSAGHAALDNEAKRVISKMPKWAPGIADGHYVRVIYRVPIIFSL